MSYAQDVKKQLSEIPRLKTCCEFALVYGMLFFSRGSGEFITVKQNNKYVVDMIKSICDRKKSFNCIIDSNIITIPSDFIRYNSFNEVTKNILKCPHCNEMILRGIFFSNGTVNDPTKSYRLEIVLNRESDAKELMEYLSKINIPSLYTQRSGKSVVYLRKSEAIEDFFAKLGATNLAFDIMNEKINKELINNANRVTNCDSANISKAIQASEKYVQVIKELINSGDINKLPDILKEMALKRLDHNELSFAELGKQFSPPISKSGIYHRLEKILDFYNNLKKN